MAQQHNSVQKKRSGGRPGVFQRTNVTAIYRRIAIGSLALASVASAWVSPGRNLLVQSGAKGSSKTRQQTIIPSAASPLYYSSRHQNNDISSNSNNNENNNKQWIETIFQMGRNVAATATLASVLLLSPDALAPESLAQHHFLTPPISYAESVLGQPGQTPTKQEVSVLDEVWTLINKYYIDRSFNGQDWNKVRGKYNEKLEKAGKEDDAKTMKLVTEMVQSLGDKYTRILDVGQYAAIQKFDLIGVGVTLMPDQDKQIIVGSPPVPKSASALVGLKVGDKVTAINSMPTSGRTAFDIIDQIAENPNAKTVTMTIERDGKIKEYTMDRAFQEVKDPIRYKISEVRDDGTKVGFIRILEFNAIVKSRLQDALKALEAENVNAYVMDLRMNTGGAFQSAVEISSLFMQDKVATYVVDSSGANIPFKTTKGELAIDKTDPMVIWVDGTSASASEVLAGALHDNCRASVMGSKSFGKGLIQAVYGLKNGAGLVLTVARYVTPGGSEIQGVGITPDIKGGVPLMIPGLSTDTSAVDFKDIAERLDPSMCTVPDFKLPSNQ